MTEPLAPDELDALCTKDAPHPRLLLRLAPAELVSSSLRAAVAVDDAMVPASFSAAPTKHADEALVVSRDFLEDMDHLASAAAKLAGAPGAALACDVAKFGVDAGCTTAFAKQLTARLFRGRADGDEVTALVELARGVAGRSKFGAGPLTDLLT